MLGLLETDAKKERAGRHKRHAYIYSQLGLGTLTILNILFNSIGVKISQLHNKHKWELNSQVVGCAAVDKYLQRGGGGVPKMRQWFGGGNLLRILPKKFKVLPNRTWLLLTSRVVSGIMIVEQNR